MHTVSKEDWRAVRRQRSNPPALAGEFDDRRQVFQGALAQAEELWDAAAVAGPASRPLPLFYCLSQAGRAVCAAWTLSETFRPTSHGLRRHESDDPAPEVRAFAYAASVTDRELGAYSMVAEATASTRFTGEASVAELWASMPGFPTPSNIFGERPRCLTLHAVQAPDDERPLLARIASPTHCVFQFLRVELADLPTLYPTIQRIEQDGTSPNLLGGEDPIYTFPTEDGNLRPLNDVAIIPFYAARPLGDRVIRPRVGGDVVEPPSEFLALWALLFCLSELARYYPDTWVGALDPDRSNAAVTLEHGLDLALQRAPQLISEALRGPTAELVREEFQRQQFEAVDSAPTRAEEEAD